MRIVGGSMFGELSGKAGGLVAARNRAGQYLRSYVVPTDPRSVAQINARARFGEASSNYHSMTPAQKALWQEFASTSFNSIFNPETNVFSGFNAFVSLKNVTLNHNDAEFSTITAVPTGATPGTAAFFPYEFSYTPPSESFDLAISNGGDVITNPPSIVLPPVGVSVAPTTLVTGFTLPLTLPTSNSEFINQNGIPWGVAVYMSNTVEQAGMFVQNPYLHLLGSTGYVDLDSTGAYTNVVFTVTPDTARLAEFGRLPATGEIVQVTIVGVAIDGRLKVIGSAFTEV